MRNLHGVASSTERIEMRTRTVRGGLPYVNPTASQFQTHTPCKSFRRPWWVSMLLGLGIPLLALARQASKSDAELAREGAVALATAHGDTPRYGGKFLSAGNEEIPFYDMHQTSFGGVYAAVAPA